MTSFPTLVNPQSHRDRLNYINSIQQMYKSYHCPSLNLLQDCISFYESSQNLKRIYQDFEYSNKITLLSQYYQYHQELPRIFQKDIKDIIQNHQDDIRNLQYKFVKKKMREDESGYSHRPKSQRPVQKIIKNIELSYYNFEKKNVKKGKESDRGSKSKLTKQKKSMPMLPLYQYQHKIQRDVGVKCSGQINIKIKESNGRKSKSKDPSKRVSANNSIDMPKNTTNNLNRTKSKSSLAPTQFQNRRPLTSHNNKVTNKSDKIKVSTPSSSLHKVQSSRNVQERKPLQEKNFEQRRVSRRESIKKEQQQGMKNMFKKVMQTKKMIKLNK